jgi:hypothetical protein
LTVAPGQQLPVGGQSSLHFSDQTLRQIAHISLGGSRLRVALSNTFGTVPLTIGAAQVALRDKDATIVPESNRVLTFGGAARTVAPAGAILISDPVDLVVPDFADLAIDRVKRDLYLFADRDLASDVVEKVFEEGHLVLRLLSVRCLDGH